MHNTRNRLKFCPTEMNHWKGLELQCLSLLEMSIPNFSSSLQSGPWSAFSQASTCTVSKLFFGCFGLNLWKCQKYVIYQKNNDKGRNQLIDLKSKRFPLISTNWYKSKYRKKVSSTQRCVWTVAFLVD